jgi:hypothetical protein
MATNCFLLDMMCVTPAGKEFLGAINTSGQSEVARYIVEVMMKYFIEVGP